MDAFWFGFNAWLGKIFADVAMTVSVLLGLFIIFGSLLLIDTVLSKFRKWTKR